MCRFNLILTHDERAIQILENNGYHKMFDHVNQYPAYQKGYCNCGSCVGGFLELKGRTFEAAVAETKHLQLERLYQIKDFMNQPGYQERKEIYSQKVNELFEAMILHQPLDPPEMNPEYQDSTNMLREYQQENDLMQESVCYYRTEEEENADRNTGIPLNQIIELPEEVLIDNMAPEEYLIVDGSESVMEPKSFVIDAVITRTEYNDYTNYQDEFAEYACLFSELLNEVPDIILGTIWSEPENMKLVKTISFESFCIEDLIYLNFNEMILLHK